MLMIKMIFIAFNKPTILIYDIFAHNIETDQNRWHYLDE